MNKTKIEWTKGPNGEPGYTWNPVTGCLHGCSYCYARRVAERFASPLYKVTKRFESSISPAEFDRIRTSLASGRGRVYSPMAFGGAFPFGFGPTFYTYRLDEPKKLRKPARIFAVSMGDLFGDWVPREWIDAVMETVRACPWHTFIFLTKNPARYVEIDWPENAWAGVTVEDQKLAEKRIPALLQTNATVKFVSLEPLLGPVELYQIAEDRGDAYGDGAIYIEPFTGERWMKDGFEKEQPPTGKLDWVILGAQTGPRGGQTRFGVGAGDYPPVPGCRGTGVRQK